MILALTGGVATGKSQACSLLRELYSRVEIFDCDESVAGFYNSTSTHKEIEATLNRTFRTSAGDFDKAALREYAFSDENSRKRLESVFHPLVREELLAHLADFAKRNTSALFVADVPLLFENDFDFGQEINVVVATSRATQKYRLKKRNDFEDELVEKILRAQMPIERKVELADHVLWNEGPPEILRCQLRSLLAHYNIL